MYCQYCGYPIPANTGWPIDVVGSPGTPAGTYWFCDADHYHRWATEEDDE